LPSKIFLIIVISKILVKCLVKQICLKNTNHFTNSFNKLVDQYNTWINITAHILQKDINIADSKNIEKTIKKPIIIILAIKHNINNCKADEKLIKLIDVSKVSILKEFGNVTEG
jgi:hypothetical protein